MKILKVLLISIILIVGLFVAAMLFIGPSDPIILTEEEELQQNQSQISAYANTDLSGFSTTAISGEEVTSDIFSDYDITMVNIWFTGCSPCIEEMPEIAKLHEDLPENYNIITICTDTIKDNGEKDKSSIKFATEVMEDANSQFYTLIPDSVLKEQISDVTTIFPTTIFVDKNGKSVGKPHFGGRTAEDYLNAIEERDSLLNNK